MSYRAPRSAERYESLFGCPLRFGAPRTTIRVWKEWFDSPASPHDAEFNAICVQHCESVQRRVEQARPLTSELRWLFTRSDSGALPSLEDAAARLHLTSRTLRRRLREEGTNYRNQVDEFRAERARQYLSYGNLSSKEIAFALGFQEQSAFRHAFKAWTGMTVREYRQQVRGASSSEA
jgi:AraC-like DNA-binding protein